MDNIMMDSDMLMEESLEKILELLENKKYFQARDELLKYNGVDIAELLEEVTEETDIDMTIILFRLLPKDVSVEVFSELPTDDQFEIVNGITDKEITFIVQEMDFDDKIDVLGRTAGQCGRQDSREDTEERTKADQYILNYPIPVQEV